MSIEIEVVWRPIKTKRFRGKDRVEKARRFAAGIAGEGIEAFEVRDGDKATAWFDLEADWNRVEMDG